MSEGLDERKPVVCGLVYEVKGTRCYGMRYKRLREADGWKSTFVMSKV